MDQFGKKAKCFRLKINDSLNTCEDKYCECQELINMKILDKIFENIILWLIHYKPLKLKILDIKNKLKK